MVILAGMTLTDHFFPVPLEHTDPAADQITLFVREVVHNDKQAEDLPFLVYLSGGPGLPGPRPLDQHTWLAAALQHYRVLLPDYRGIALSDGIGRHTARHRTPAQLAEYLGHFRADSIVRDLELIRPHFTGGAPWSILAQSYGGFCAVSYLSFAPDGLREAFIAGGLPALGRSADDVYRATYRRVLERNDAYFRRYPADREVVRRVCEKMRNSDVRLIDGSPLPVSRFQQVGIILGYSYGAERIHQMLEYAFAGTELSDQFLLEVYNIITYIGHPLYAVLHETIYADGNRSPRWAAARIAEEYPQLSADESAPLFAGEMMSPEMFEHDPVLIPFREAADILAQRADWPPLYNFDALKSCTVPAAACIYVDDMYVERAFSEETARLIPSLTPWITNEFPHDGLQSDGERVFGRLFDIVRNRV
jgi:pimeloyl-ACP methyl ester carboxylesterase